MQQNDVELVSSAMRSKYDWSEGHWSESVQGGPN